MEKRVCALTHMTLGTAERQVIVMVPVSSSGGRDSRWELQEVARVNGDSFDALAARLGFSGGRIPGIESISSGKVWPSAVPSAMRRFHFQTFVAIRPKEETQQLVATLPFLARHLQDAVHCMSDGDKRRDFLRGAGSTQALDLRPVAF